VTLRLPRRENPRFKHRADRAARGSWPTQRRLDPQGTAQRWRQSSPASPKSSVRRVPEPNTKVVSRRSSPCLPSIDPNAPDRESAPALRPSKLDCVLEPGTRVPDVHVWTAPREESRPLKEVLGTGRSYLCFYLWDCERATHRALPSARGLRGRRQGRRRYLVVREQTPSCACADDELTSRMRERSEREHPVEARRAASPRCEGLGSRAGRAARSSASGAASTTRTRERLRSSRHSRDRV